MKITLEVHGIVASYEDSDNDHPTSCEVAQAMWQVLLSAGYQRESVASSFGTIVDEHDEYIESLRHD